MNAFLWFSFGMLLSGGICSLWIYNKRKQKRERILGLTQYLEAASFGRESVLARKEDEFSLLEDEMYKTVSELRIAREEAQKERQQQADNLADIAHQIKTPLTSMSLLTQLIEASALPQQEEYIQRLNNSLTRLEWLTNALLLMSRLDAKAVEFALVTIPFEELAVRSWESMEQILEERKQILTILGKEEMVCCDPYWMSEAVTNLIKNCSEHTPEKGSIQLQCTTTPLYQQITVEDNGTGFCPYEIPHLFRRFFRGKNSNKNSIGIGLALTRAIVEGQGGLIHGENRVEGGARFVIRFYP